jgi:anti-sigma B factor antagonist
MPLSLETRDIGRVTIVRCKGRLVAGGEVESLRSHITWLLRDRRLIVLHLGDLVFIDSSGIGTMVRTLASTRQARGDLKLCDVPPHVRKVLELSHLTTIFDSHESEDHAVAAFYHAPARVEPTAATEHSVLCVGRNADVLAYLRELLRRSGYDVHTTHNVRDAVLLTRVMRFDLLLIETGLTAAPGTEQAFQNACAKIPVIELGDDFSTLEAGDATAELLAKVAARLHPTANQPS